MARIVRGVQGRDGPARAKRSLSGICPGLRRRPAWRPRNFGTPWEQPAGSESARVFRLSDTQPPCGRPRPGQGVKGVFHGEVEDQVRGDARHAAKAPPEPCNLPVPCVVATRRWSPAVARDHARADPTCTKTILARYSLSPTEACVLKTPGFGVTLSRSAARRGGGRSRGPLDQWEIEEREDVLIYTTPSLRRQVEVTDRSNSSSTFPLPPGTPTSPASWSTFAPKAAPRSSPTASCVPATASRSRTPDL